MILSTGTCNILKAVPIVNQIRLHGISEVEDKVKKALIKCASALGIDLSELQIDTLSEDLVDVYSHDSIEDIYEALKMGRQGKFGTTFNKLNMIVVSEWMSFQLDLKAQIREKELEKSRIGKKEPLEEVNYQEYIERTKKESKEEKPKTLSQMQYDEMKHRYFKDKNK